MKLFDAINAELLKMEGRKPYVYPEPRVNPSELSALLTDSRRNKVTGRCKRQTAFKLFGMPPSERMKPKSARIFRIGRFMEDEVTKCLKNSGLLVASGIRFHAPDLIMSSELDIVCINPTTQQAIVIDNKTIKNEWAMNDVHDGKPKNDNVMQLCMYLDYIRTGKRLKELIAAGLKDRSVAEEFDDFSMNRIEVIEENLEKISDGPITGKLLYEDRSDCEDGEVDIDLYRNESDGKTYPTINGVPSMEFSLESVYQRRAEIQQYWRAMVAEAKVALAAQNIHEPQPPQTAFGPNVNDPAYKAAKSHFWSQVGAYFQSLPPSRWPEPDYDYKYSQEKLDYLHKQGLLKKTEITAKNKGERIGDFNCNYCDWQSTCVAARYPEYRNLLTNIQPNLVPMERRA